MTAAKEHERWWGDVKPIRKPLVTDGQLTAEEVQQLRGVWEEMTRAGIPEEIIARSRSTLVKGWLCRLLRCRSLRRGVERCDVLRSTSDG